MMARANERFRAYGLTSEHAPAAPVVEATLTASRRARAPAIGAIVGATLVATAPLAAARSAAADPVERGPSFLVVGVGALADYEGADTLQTVPLVVARTRVGRASLEVSGSGARLGVIRRGGVAAGPVLGFTGARDDGAADERVAALRPLDPSLEAGAFVAWSAALGTFEEGEAELGATLTRSVGGGWEGVELALDAEYAWAAMPIWRVALAVSASVVDETYASSRFGVSAADAAVSGLAVHAPAGGLKDVGVSLRSVLSFSRAYGLFARVAYTRLLGDAAESPIVEEAGSADQTFVGAGLFVSFGR